MAKRIAHGMRASFAGKPVAALPGGEASRGNGSREPGGGGGIGRDAFTRPKEQGTC